MIAAEPLPEKGLSHKKGLGQYFTPEAVAQTIVRWLNLGKGDLLLDPSCGDGRFLAAHRHEAVGIEFDEEHVQVAQARNISATVIRADFFTWAATSTARFSGVAGNPPFIRYQRFNGELRERALRLARNAGAALSNLTSSWAPFIVVAASLLRPGGRLGFIVPAEIGHASYCAPLLEFLSANFSHVQIIAIRGKIFQAISEDAWILLADGYGGQTDNIILSVLEQFTPSRNPPGGKAISLAEWRASGQRLRKFLLPSPLLNLYQASATSPFSYSLGSLARVGIGYVTGDNDFFHLTPSIVREFAMPPQYLKVAVRKGGQLPDGDVVSLGDVRSWIANDEQILLLAIPADNELDDRTLAYLATDAASKAQRTYKCRVRSPWYSVPDVTVPDGFLTYMSGDCVALVANEAGCVATNSLHVVHLGNGTLTFTDLQRRFSSTLSQLSCELEGHPLGGGMLKLEPREAQRVRIPVNLTDPFLLSHDSEYETALQVMRSWRHQRNVVASMSENVIRNEQGEPTLRRYASASQPQENTC